jgi:hypothetical protein
MVSELRLQRMQLSKKPRISNLMFKHKPHSKSGFPFLSDTRAFKNKISNLMMVTKFWYFRLSYFQNGETYTTCAIKCVEASSEFTEKTFIAFTKEVSVRNIANDAP